MKASAGLLALCAGLLCWRSAGFAMPRLSGQTFVDAAAMSAAAGSGIGAGIASQDSGPFTDGTKAINESRWADAVKIFADVADQHGEHADGALYWKAYAEEKLGQSKPAQQTCSTLRAGYPGSRWLEDCGALEVEIRARTGKHVEIEPGQNDDVKLLALNAMMHQDEPRALAEIQAILNGDASERLKKEAQFILGTHYSNVTYAQIVRISYMEGDVRIERGGADEKAAAKTNAEPWEKAEVNLPLETGFSLVTGAGRAEIEFENASTLYLGENSVLTFNDLHATAGVPYTELALLSGTTTLHIQPYVAGEEFILHTPTNDVVSRYPDRTYARIESFSDGIAVSSLEHGALRLSGVTKESIEPGRTFVYKAGQALPEEEASTGTGTGTTDAWDKWVGDRVTARDAAVASVMKAAGLPAAIPGLAEMTGQGKFFDCAPFGTCWEPNADANEDETAGAEQALPSHQRGAPHMVLASFDFSESLQESPAMRPAQPRAGIGEDSFPCLPASLRYRSTKDQVTGRQTVIDTGTNQQQAYGWAVCHSGSWIRHNKHYAWVASCKRHHIPPVRWVKSGRTIAFAPLHPYDVKGQPAINARHEVFEVSGKGEVAVHAGKLEPNMPIEYLKEAPKEYRNTPLQPLAHVDAPRMEARSLGRGSETGRAVVPIHFDVRSRSFMVPRAGTHPGKVTTAFTPITNRSGSLQARGGSFAGASGMHSVSSSAHSGVSHGGGAGGAHVSGSGGASHSSASSHSGSSSSAGSAHH
jgi:hypothetical protein